MVMKIMKIVAVIGFMDQANWRPPVTEHSTTC